MIENKAYILKNFDKYGIQASENVWKKDLHPITQAEMLALLNILDAHGENLDSFHDASFNGYSDFCDIFGRFENDNDTYNALMQFNKFIPNDEFADWMLEHIQDTIDNYDGDYEEAMKSIKEVAFDENCDDMIIKTEDGYVHSVRY